MCYSFLQSFSDSLLAAMVAVRVCCSSSMRSVASSTRKRLSLSCRRSVSFSSLILAGILSRRANGITGRPLYASTMRQSTISFISSGCLSHISTIYSASGPGGHPYAAARMSSAADLIFLLAEASIIATSFPVCWMRMLPILSYASSSAFCIHSSFLRPYWERTSKYAIREYACARSCAIATRCMSVTGRTYSASRISSSFSLVSSIIKLIGAGKPTNLFVGGTAPSSFPVLFDADVSARMDDFSYLPDSNRCAVVKGHVLAVTVYALHPAPASLRDHGISRTD